MQIHKQAKDTHKGQLHHSKEQEDKPMPTSIKNTEDNLTKTKNEKKNLCTSKSLNFLLAVSS